MRRRLTVLAGALLGSALAGQTQFSELRKQPPLPPGNGATSALATGDVDGNGTLDVFCCNGIILGAQNHLSLGDGRGHFTDVTTLALPVDENVTHDAVFADIDGDGDLDIALANSFGYTTTGLAAQQNRLYLNDGSGNFTDVTATRLPADNDSTHAVATGDVDRDGDLDLIFGNSLDPFGGRTFNRLYLNDGTGSFLDATVGRLPPGQEDTHAVLLADLDADGDLDIVCVNDSWNWSLGRNRLYFNDGTGRFSEAPATMLPAIAAVNSAAAAGDVDRDGDLDIVIASRHPASSNHLLLNDGGGSFTDVTAQRLPIIFQTSADIALADADGDGDLDIALANDYQNRLYLNDGRGNFTDTTGRSLPPDRDTTTAVTFGDVDGDGRLDVICGNSGSDNLLYYNDGNAAFRHIATSSWPERASWTWAVTLGDVDGDGDLDALLGTGSQTVMFLNDGRGGFRDVTATALPIDSDLTAALALGDVDGDGDLDLMLANHGQDKLYQNDGTGRFTDVSPSQMPLVNTISEDLALDDLDGDGDLDALVVSYQRNLYYENDGTGTFRDASAKLPAQPDDWTGAVVTGDVDGDGRPDFVFGQRCQRSVTTVQPLANELFLNHGPGGFVNASSWSLPPDTDQTEDVALGDVDGDGDLDLVCGNVPQTKGGGIPGGRNTLYLNDGRGVFTDVTASSMPLDTDTTRSIALGDLDGDGDLDLFCANGFNYEVNRVYLNDGAGHFSAPAIVRLPDDMLDTSEVALGDLDGDGDLDAVCANQSSGGNGSQRYLNLLRHLDNPRLVVRGGNYQLDYYARPGFGIWPHVAITFVSDAEQSIAIPNIGTLGIAMSNMIVLSGVLIPAPAGTLTRTFPVLDDPSLIGKAVFAQALFLDQATPAHLTNVLADTVVR